MKIYVSIESQSASYDLYQAENLRSATRLMAIAHQGGKAARVLWLPESASEILREIKRGAFWARKMWHDMSVPESCLKKTAWRRWAKKVG